jgi:lipopolysaccharide/colanic/teichoic acid biosynthesis glycosyltransferase
MPTQFETGLAPGPAVHPSEMIEGSLLALSNALEAAREGSQTRRPHSAFPFKRAIDVVGAALLILLLLPVLLACCLAVLFTCSAPVFYSHRRVGRSGKEFFVWKFRSMCNKPDQVLQSYLQTHPEKQGEWLRTQKLVDDPRVTPVGRFMRRYSLDELPQLWNVIRGDMSLIGPRPIVKGEIPKYGDAIAAYYAVRPGMTGLWQVSGRSNTTYTERVLLDRRYSEEWSPSMELAIVMSTFRVVLTGDGAY